MVVGLLNVPSSTGNTTTAELEKGRRRNVFTNTNTNNKAHSCTLLVKLQKQQSDNRNNVSND
jgi:hypothetical protein